MELDCDFLVIGAGISGAAAAFELSAHGSVAVLEAESRPGYHSTGRSAALYTRHFGGPTVRKLSAAGLPFFTNPPAGFAEHPLLTPRAGLTVANSEERGEIDALLELGAADGSIVELTRAGAAARTFRRPIAFAAFEEGILDMDVAAIHQGFLRGLKARGGQVICDAPIARLERIGRAWHAASDNTLVRAPIAVNAAGAWADKLAALAGAAPVGLVPKRRTAIQIDLPKWHGYRSWPAVDEAGYGCYVKPKPAASWPRRPMPRLRSPAILSPRITTSPSSPTGWNAGPRFPCGASTTNGRACAISSPMSRRWPASTTRCRDSSGSAVRAATASCCRQVWGAPPRNSSSMVPCLPIWRMPA
jgi:glycine/D-amino acid oxidase-like deaminating enzyme